MHPPFTHLLMAPSMAISRPYCHTPQSEFAARATPRPSPGAPSCRAMPPLKPRLSLTADIPLCVRNWLRIGECHVTTELMILVWASPFLPAGWERCLAIATALRQGASKKDAPDARRHQASPLSAQRSPPLLLQKPNDSDPETVKDNFQRHKLWARCTGDVQKGI